MPEMPIVTPGRFAPPYAVGFANAVGDLNLVSANSPLPVSLSSVQTPPTLPAPLAGTAAASGTSAAFKPALATPVTLTLRGTWQGQVRVYRSTDGGITLDALTVGGAPWATFTSNACEGVWEENDGSAALYLGFTLASGSVSYRLAH